MTHITETVAKVVPRVYRMVAEDFKYPPHANPATSNQCHVLSQVLHRKLLEQGIESRREFHQLSNDRIWHFVIAHSSLGVPPSQHDIITDLNPWQFLEHPPEGYTYLHGTRSEVMQRLEEEGAPSLFVALRSLDTVVHAHTDMPRPRIPY